MDTCRKLNAQRTQIIEQIAALGPMRRGSISEQMLPYRKPDGSTGRRGPYLTYTFKQGGKTCGKHLRNQDQADRYQCQIQNYRQYQELSAQLVQVSQALADLEDADAAGGKKNSRR